MGTNDISSLDENKINLNEDKVKLNKNKINLNEKNESLNEDKIKEIEKLKSNYENNKLSVLKEIEELKENILFDGFFNTYLSLQRLNKIGDFLNIPLNNQLK